MTTTRVFSVLGFVAHLKTLESDVKVTSEAIVARACEMVAAEAKRVLGTYDYGWPELNAETIARKVRGDSPLLETGELRASIEWHAEGLRGEVGSNSDIAVWQELGTRTIPPRSFLAGAAAATEKQIYAMASKAVHAVLRGEGLHSSEMAELLHLLKHAAHSAKETVDTLLEPDEDTRR